MKLVSFDDYKVGIAHDGIVVDVTDFVGGHKSGWPPVAMNHLIGDFANLRGKLESARSRPGIPLTQVRLRTPVPGTTKIIAYPINYHAHGDEMGRGYRANTPGLLAPKPLSSLIGPSEPIVLATRCG